MSVYVDELLPWPTRIRCFRDGACHMTADTVAELHAFAARLGLKRTWFQPHRVFGHYDLTRGRREDAVRLGAVEVTGRWLILRKNEARARGEAWPLPEGA